MEKRRKLVKLSTTRVRNLNPTELQLIFQFLEVPEHARALRVCATWSQAGRQPLSWPSSITCNNDQVDFLIANGCKKPKRVLGFGLGRRNFRPPVQWADHLRVLHLRSVVSHEAPKMSDSTAHTILEGCSNLEQLHWYDLFSLPRDFKWPPKLRELKLQFWIKKETPQWNPGGLPATLELLSVTHESAPGFSRAAYWDNLNDAVPFHCPALHTLVFNACGNVGWVTPPDAPFQSTQLRRLHLNVLLWNVQFNHVLRALVDNPPVLEDLKMPEFFGGPDKSADTELMWRLAPSLRTLWIHAAFPSDPYGMAIQADQIQQLRKGLKLRELFLYNDENCQTEALAFGILGGWQLCGHAYYDQMEGCKRRGKEPSLMHFIKKREDESDYESESE